MEDICFSIYRNKEIQKITLQDLASNKRVLICSAVRIIMHLTDQYIKHIEEQIPYYKDNGIDEVYIVNSDSGLFALARFDRNFPNLPVLADTDQQFVKWVSESVNKTTPALDKLSRYWNYQVLLNDGKIEQWYEQPTENYVKHVIKAGYKPNIHYQKFFLTESNEVALYRPTLTKQEQNFTDDTKVGDRCTPMEFMYFNLCPNVKLNQYLLDTSK